jgi:hypothetical protein
MAASDVSVMDRYLRWPFPGTLTSIQPAPGTVPFRAVRVERLSCGLIRRAWGWPRSCRFARSHGSSNLAAPGCATVGRGLLRSGLDDDARHKV